MVPNRYIFNLIPTARTFLLCCLLIFGVSLQSLSAQCSVKAGTLGPPQVFFSENSTVLKADFKDAPVLENGFFNWFVLAVGDGRLIQQLSTEPAFELKGDGKYSIHSLVFKPEEFDVSEIDPGQTTVVDLAEMILSVEGCSDFDFSGTAVEVYGPTNICGAFSGLLMAEETTCLDDSLVQIAASEYIPAIIPEAYVQVFLLSSTDSALITAVNESPEFVVPRTDSFKIHSFVYDTLSFNLDSIQFDTSTIESISKLLGQERICASLDGEGVIFLPVDCLPECIADAGSLQPGEQDCLSDGTKRIYALPDKDPVVPEGFLTTYLLSSGADRLIRGLSNTPSFILEGEGRFTIHTLVYDTAGLSLDSVIVGKTKAGSILEKLIQGGGSTCGALDLEGASIELGDCPCLAQFGTLEPSDACLDENGAVLEASVLTKAVVPQGYEQLFILTSGDDLIIRELSNEPYFEIDEIGQFAIHNLVFNPGSLPLTWIQYGQTSLNILNDFLIQGGGDICAALDINGATFVVDECQTPLLSPITYPNPVRDRLNIQIPTSLDQKPVSIQLIDGVGNISLYREADGPLEVISMDVSELPEGWYGLRMLYGDGRVGISKIYISK